jgi:Domain of unknown function (DUF6457)
MATLDEWTAQVSEALGVPPEALDRDLVLDLARDAAHRVARPAAPLTTYLAGVAVGQGASPADVVTTLRSLLPPPPPDGARA